MHFFSSINQVSLVSLKGGKLHNGDSVVDGSARVAECDVHGSSGERARERERERERAFVKVEEKMIQ